MTSNPMRGTAAAAVTFLFVAYNDFAPLDGPPPLAATLGPEGVAEFLRKGAGLINQVEQSVLKRWPDVSN